MIESECVCSLVCFAWVDRAGCLRRARKLDEAVADLDAALRLFPRYARALFRRAACLLEAGKAPMAVEAFKDLYRVDRSSLAPSLSRSLFHRGLCCIVDC